MAAAADKARFFLESSVAELREWERRELFTRDEISAVVVKRAAYEHTLNARGAATPAEWARYITYEMNLDALRTKRVARKKMKATAQGHAAQQRIFLLLDRATRRFPGSFELWMQYIEYGRKQRANKKVSRIFTNVLRLHPTKDYAWIYAAKWSTDVQADLQAARSFFQRGLRFCPRSKPLYLEYARLEMSQVAKIAVRRHVLGLDIEKHASTEMVLDENDANADMIALPSITPGELGIDALPQTDIDEAALAQLSLAPALTGAIPTAIFDAAQKTFNNDQSFGEDFFNVFAEFGYVACASRLVYHVADGLFAANPKSPYALSCRCRAPLVGVAIDSPNYPAVLGETLKLIAASMDAVPDKESELAQRLLSWLVPIAEAEELAPELKRVLSATTRRLSKRIPQSGVTI